MRCDAENCTVYASHFDLWEDNVLYKWCERHYWKGRSNFQDDVEFCREISEKEYVIRSVMKS